MKSSFNRKGAFSVLFAFALSVALFLKACSAPAELKTLRVGFNRWPGFDIALYAREAGLFEARGLDVEFSLFDVGQDTSRSLLNGSLDAAFVSLWELMQVDVLEQTPVYIMVTNVSAGADGIVVAPDIESVANLKGKTVAAKLGSVNHLILLEALEASGLQPEDVTIEDVSNDIAAQRLAEGRVDAAVLWEPALSELAKQIGGSVPFTTQDVDSLVIDGLATRKDYLEDNREAIQRFLLAWFDLMEAVETQPEEVFATVGELVDLSPEAFAEDYSGLAKGDIALNKRMFAEDGRLEEAKREIVGLLERDTRHSRIVREDIEIDSEPIANAIETWQEENSP